MKSGNASETDFSSNLSITEDYLVVIIMGLAGIISIFLNSSVLHVARHDWKKVKVFEVYSVYLASADLFMTLIDFPMVIISAFFHKWIFGSVGCQIYAFSGFVYGLSSIGILTIIGILRYLRMCTSFAGCYITPKLVGWSMVLIVSFSMLWSVLPFLGWGAYDFETTMLSCTLNWHDDVQVAYIICTFIVALAAPVIVIVFSYSSIMFFINKHHQSSEIRSQKVLKPIKLAISMCIGFIFAWFPYAVVSMWAAYGDPESIPVRVTAVPVFMAKLATVYNPVLYFFHNKSHREMLKKLMSKCMFGTRIGASENDLIVATGTERTMVYPLSSNVQISSISEDNPKETTDDKLNPPTRLFKLVPRDPVLSTSIA